jgi:uncharacterized protein with HEPN domain
MQPEQKDKAYLWDMLDAARMVEQLSSGHDLDSYSKDRRTQLAIERSLEIIGEAAGKVSNSFRNGHPEIPWRQIICQRNVLIHEYGEIKQDRIWKVVQDNIPQLIEQLNNLV